MRQCDFVALTLRACHFLPWDGSPDPSLPAKSSIVMAASWKSSTRSRYPRAVSALPSKTRYTKRASPLSFFHLRADPSQCVTRFALSLLFGREYHAESRNGVV